MMSSTIRAVSPVSGFRAESGLTPMNMVPAPPAPRWSTSTMAPSVWERMPRAVSRTVREG